MAKGSLTIRRQIKSITNTKKMTKAMELVSASKMRRSVQAALAARPYSTGANELLSYLAPRADKDLHPLLAERTVKRIGIILVSTNRGLCGGFNANLTLRVNALAKQEKEHGAESVVLYTLGKRGRDYCARAGLPIAGDFPKSDITRSVESIIPLIKTVTEQYAKGELDKIVLSYMNFQSSVRQTVSIEQLLPLVPKTSEASSSKDLSQVIFEPSEGAVLDFVLVRLLEATVYHAVLESEASEHSARMMAMHNASEAATDMLFDLQLTYNQARQAAITQEIAEISSGRAALE